MLKYKLVKVFIVIVGLNIAGVIAFYGWVLTSQHHQRAKMAARDLKVMRNGGTEDWNYRPGTGPTGSQDDKQWGRDLEKVESTPHKGMDMVLGGHTLKPPKRLPASVANIPPVPGFSEGDFVLDLDPSIMKTFQRYPEKPAKDTVLILSPIHDVEGKLKSNFLSLLESLTYPHHLISIAFGEDSSHDNTLHVAEQIAKELRKSFASVKVFHFNLTGQVEGSWSNVHSKQNQLHRRQHMAQARNRLLKAGLENQTWTLWIDSDISHLPPDIIQQLLSAEEDIVTPLCLYRDNRKLRVFDKNTWRETNESLRYQKTLAHDALMVEGYEDTKRLWLSDLRAEGRVVPIDGVGGCTLLIKSRCHKAGLEFPEKIFDHHVETEGLAKMAKHMGYGVFGMPFVEVEH